MFSGSSQLTCRLVLDTAVTVGANGVSGGSAMSVTLIVTLTVALPPLVSVALTVTECLDFSSWFRSALARICPLPGSMSNDLASAPSSVWVTGSKSGSTAVTGLPIGSPALAFSVISNERVPAENIGFWLATSGFGDPVPDRDHSPVISPLFARTSTCVARARRQPGDDGAPVRAVVDTSPGQSRHRTS